MTTSTNAATVRMLRDHAVRQHRAMVSAAKARERLHAAIVRAHRNGMTMREIADATGYTFGRVAQIVRADANR